jgi:SAM-dependent methyltransferase
MDKKTKYNQGRWNELSREGVEFGRPWLDLTKEKAEQETDPYQMLGKVANKQVLLLASGGGQQSAAFGFLGAKVTVVDFSDVQLAADKKAAEHYGHNPKLLQRDMRDLSCFEDNAFDIVWHGHSIGFIPEVETVFKEVARVLRPGGYYRMSCCNPFFARLHEGHWNGKGYVMNGEYKQGAEMEPGPWDIWDEKGKAKKVQGPYEYIHTLSTLINIPISLGFILLGAWEGGIEPGPHKEGSWGHFTTVCPPYLEFYWRKDHARKNAGQGT